MPFFNQFLDFRTKIVFQYFEMFFRLKEWQLESLKIWSFILFIFLRFVTVRPHLQSYLNLALDRLDELRAETGRVQNLDMQRMIARIFLYFFVAAVQYFAPVLLILSFVLMTKTLGKSQIGT